MCRNDVMTWLSNLHVTGGSLAVWKDRARYDVKIRFGDGTKVRASRFLASLRGLPSTLFSNLKLSSSLLPRAATKTRGFYLESIWNCILTL